MGENYFKCQGHPSVFSYSPKSCNPDFFTALCSSAFEHRVFILYPLFPCVCNGRIGLNLLVFHYPKWKSGNVRIIEVIQSEQQRENIFFKNEESLRDSWAYNKIINIHITRVLEGEQNVHRTKKLSRNNV